VLIVVFFVNRSPKVRGPGDNVFVLCPVCPCQFPRVFGAFESGGFVGADDLPVFLPVGPAFFPVGLGEFGVGFLVLVGLPFCHIGLFPGHFLIGLGYHFSVRLGLEPRGRERAGLDDRDKHRVDLLFDGDEVRRHDWILRGLLKDRVGVRLMDKKER
jgi:hypothetical protein